MRTLTRLYRTGILSLTLIAPFAMAPSAQPADDDHRQETRRYHDARHNDDHEWNDRENRAYDKWLKEKHHAKREFAKLKAKEQREYWKWRHEHPDREG